MKYIPLLFLFLITFSCDPDSQVAKDEETTLRKQWAVIIHGGAGGLRQNNLSETAKTEYQESLRHVLDHAVALLKDGKSALEVVESGIMKLEDNPIFNAGKGSVLNNVGVVEMDASIMDGKTLDAGAIAGSKIIKNPIQAARYVKDSTAHVLLSSSSGDEWAKGIGLETREPEYFITGKSKEILRRYQEKNLGTVVDENKGTVGMAVLDMNGNLAAGTSTGGMTNKQYGRIGDSPIIGAGTYADNNTCAVSCTGHGEKFIRLSIAHRLSMMLEWSEMGLQEAIDYIINEDLASIQGDGGLIAVDAKGNIGFGFNTPSMLRAWATPDSLSVAIFE